MASIPLLVLLLSGGCLAPEDLPLLLEEDVFALIPERVGLGRFGEVGLGVEGARVLPAPEALVGIGCISSPEMVLLEDGAQPLVVERGNGLDLLMRFPREAFQTYTQGPTKVRGDGTGDVLLRGGVRVLVEEAEGEASKVQVWGSDSELQGGRVSNEDLDIVYRKPSEDLELTIDGEAFTVPGRPRLRTSPDGEVLVTLGRSRAARTGETSGPWLEVQATDGRILATGWLHEQALEPLTDELFGCVFNPSCGPLLPADHREEEPTVAEGAWLSSEPEGVLIGRAHRDLHLPLVQERADGWARLEVPSIWGRLDLWVDPVDRLPGGEGLCDDRRSHWDEEDGAWHELLSADLDGIR